MVRREGLEPSCLAAPAPKAGASTNSATFAPEKHDKNNVLYPRVSVGHYENFPVASLLLPAPLRAPVAVIYRFARTADDFADEGNDPPAVRLKNLQDIRRQIDGPSPVAELIRDRGLPPQLFHDLVDAFSQDVTKKSYANFAEVLDYCRRSANPVGRLLLHLFKRTSETELRQSDAICSALQLVNFWQDVEADWRKDRRVYLPREDMARFGVTEKHLLQQSADDAWRRLMAFQVDRAEALMLEGAPLGRSLPGRVGLEIRATVQGGLRILQKIRAVDYDVFRRRPVLRPFDWPLLLMRAA